LASVVLPCICQISPNSSDVNSFVGAAIASPGDTAKRIHHLVIHSMSGENTLGGVCNHYFADDHNRPLVIRPKVHGPMQTAFEVNMRLGDPLGAYL
jgi:hypothetical protein